jgi:ferritin-like metal-binding protein YciE
MADPNERDAKLIQYLSEAYGKERELEMALQVDITITTKAPYTKRLKQHLKETKSHAKGLERRIKKLGGSTPTGPSLLGKATAVAKGPLHAVRGDGAAEKMLKNAKTQYTSEQEEISTYLALETFATKVGDSETASLARAIRREEERMASFLLSQIKQLASATALDEVPAAQRRQATRRKAAKKSAPKANATKAKKTATRKAAGKKAAKTTAKKSTVRKAAAKKGAKKRTANKGAKKTGGSKKAKAKKG